MSRAVALIDGEHYPPVVRFALDRLALVHEVAAAAFIGGTEKVDFEPGEDPYGVPLIRAGTADEALVEAIGRFSPELVVDLSDEPVASSADRFRLAALALARGVAYHGADFQFSPPAIAYDTRTPALAIIGTGKRVGKTAVSAYAARRLKAVGVDVAVLAMGRGGPAEPELIRGDEVSLTTKDLLELAARGRHASSDNYEDAVMSRVTTVGSRRCGGGMAGQTFFGNVEEGARLADSLDKDLLILEGSGAAIPPVARDACLLVVGARQGLGYIRDYFGPFRMALADAVLIASAEEPNAGVDEIAAMRVEVARQRPGLPCVAVIFRPKPLEPISGRDVFFATTAPEELLPKLTDHLQTEYGCNVVGASANLSRRPLLRAELAAAEGRYDTLVTELKAAAIDVAASIAADQGVPTILCDNEPQPLLGEDLDAVLDEVTAQAVARGKDRGGR